MKELLGSLELNRIYQMDCLDGVKLIPDKSINIICIDPPYNIGKDKGWDKYKKDKYLNFMGAIFKECERVLKDNGSFYWFHQDMTQIKDLMKFIEDNTLFVFKSFITIDKTDNNYLKDLLGSIDGHFRNYMNLAEYCLFYTFQSKDLKQKIGTGLQEILNDYTNFMSIKQYLVNEFKQSRLTIKKANEIMGLSTSGSNLAGDLFGIKRKRFVFPTREKYMLLQTTGFFQKPYDDLKMEYESTLLKLEQKRSEIDKKKWKEYMDSRYTFNASNGLKNVWSYSFREDKKTKHPTQKPIRLIEDIIKYSSNEDDIVLDCFMGSGTTAVAALKNNRNFIGFETESKYIEIANKRIENTYNEIDDEKLLNN